MGKRAGETDIVEESMQGKGTQPERRDPPEVAGHIERFQAGDNEAFGALYSLYFERVFSYLKLLMKCTEDAEDAAQQVFLQVMEALPDYVHRGRFESWLFRIVRNHAISEMKKSSRVTVMDPAELDAARDRPVEDPESISGAGWVEDPNLMQFIGRLSLAQRQVLFLRFVAGMNATQIAETLDRTPNDVRVLAHRAQSFLGRMMTAVGKEPEPDGREWSHSQRRKLQAPVLRARRFSLMP